MHLEKVLKLLSCFHALIKAHQKAFRKLKAPTEDFPHSSKAQKSFFLRKFHLLRPSLRASIHLQLLSRKIYLNFSLRDGAEERKTEINFQIKRKMALNVQTGDNYFQTHFLPKKLFQFSFLCFLIHANFTHTTRTICSRLIYELIIENYFSLFVNKHNNNNQLACFNLFFRV